MTVGGDAAHGVLMFPVLKQQNEGASRWLPGFQDHRRHFYWYPCSLRTNSNTDRVGYLKAGGQRHIFPASHEHCVHNAEPLCLPDRDDLCRG